MAKVQLKTKKSLAPTEKIAIRSTEMETMETVGPSQKIREDEKALARWIRENADAIAEQIRQRWERDGCPGSLRDYTHQRFPSIVNILCAPAPGTSYAVAGTEVWKAYARMAPVRRVQ